jgi:beta-glucosidase
MFDDLRSVRLEVPGREKTAMGWEIDATGLRDILVHIAQHYTDVPLYVTENGAAQHDYVDPLGRVHDEGRIAYIRDHLLAVADAREAGVDVQGYFVWSMLDNYEWAEGYSKRFGIVWVDYPTGQRIAKDSYYWYQGVVASGDVR